MYFAGAGDSIRITAGNDVTGPVIEVPQHLVPMILENKSLNPEASVKPVKIGKKEYNGGGVGGGHILCVLYM